MNRFLFIFVLLFYSVHASAENYDQAIQVQTLLKSSVDGAGRKLVYPTTGDAELTAVLVEIPPGQSTGWHEHPNPCAAYILEGEVTVEDANHVKRRFVAGGAFAEVVNLKHNGTNTGTVPVKILMFVAGSTDTPITRK